MAFENNGFFDDMDRGSNPELVTELEDYIDNDTLVDSKDLKGAVKSTEEDKKEAEIKGKASTTEDKVEKELAKKLLAEEEARKKTAKDLEKFIEGDETDLEDTDTDDLEDSKDEGDDDKKDSPDSKEKKSEIDQNDIEELATGLYNIGLFTKRSEDEKPPKTEEELIDKMYEEKVEGANELVDQLLGKHGEDYREVLENILIHGVSPKEYITKFEEVKTWKGLDMNVESNQEKVVRTSLKKAGWDDDSIDRKISKLKTNSDLEDESMPMYKALLNSEEKDLAEFEKNEKIKAQRKIDADKYYKSNINHILNDKLKEKSFDGVPLSKEIVDKAESFLVDKAWKLKDGNLITSWEYFMLALEDPQNHSIKAKLAALIAPQFEPGKPLKLDLAPVKKDAISKESKKVFDFTKNKSKMEKSSPKGGNGSENFTQYL